MGNELIFKRTDRFRVLMAPLVGQCEKWTFKEIVELADIKIARFVLTKNVLLDKQEFILQ